MTHECLPFDDESLVIKVFDKMFIFIPLEKPETITLKCDPDLAIELREKYQGIFPAWHFNKKYWNQVALQGDVPDNLIAKLIDHSYDEVVKKLTRSHREELKSLK